MFKIQLDNVHDLIDIVFNSEYTVRKATKYESQLYS